MIDKLFNRTLTFLVGIIALLIAADVGRDLFYDLSMEVITWFRSLGIPIYTFDPVWTLFAILLGIGATVRFWGWKDKDNKWKESQRRRAKLFPRDPADDVPLHTGKRRADPDPPLRL